MASLLLSDSYHVVRTKATRHLAILDTAFDGGPELVSCLCRPYRFKCSYVEPLFPPSPGSKSITIHARDFCNSCKTVLSRLTNVVRDETGHGRLYQEIVTTRLPLIEGMPEGADLMLVFADQPPTDRT